jgi:hypothetical protein
LSTEEATQASEAEASNHSREDHEDDPGNAVQGISETRRQYPESHARPRSGLCRHHRLQGAGGGRGQAPAGRQRCTVPAVAATATVALLAATPAFAGAAPRVRGVAIGVNNDSITVKERDGSTLTLKTGADTAYANVVPSSLDAIKVNDFVGTAVKGPMKSMVAVELVIIPESMRAGRISYYGWDPLPDPSVRQISDTTGTSMTNGLVSNVSPAPRKLTNTNMTNGIVSAENGGAAGLTLTVSYDGGSKSFRITVPSTAPITHFEVADRSAVAIGSSVFIKTNSGNKAGLVAVGKGVTPPM